MVNQMVYGFTRNKQQNGSLKFEIISMFLLLHYFFVLFLYHYLLYQKKKKFYSPNGIH